MLTWHALRVKEHYNEIALLFNPPQRLRDMSSKTNAKVDEEQILASPSPICKQKITFYQK